MRAPVVAGVSGGVGTTTLAVALRGRDAGVAGGGPGGADILACRCTGDSLRRAAAVARHAAWPGPRPVLAVTVEGAPPRRGPLHDGLAALRPAFAALVLLPHVASWREFAEPHAVAASLLAHRADELPRPLRGYADALRRLAAEVASSGRLTGPVARPVVPPPPAAAVLRPVSPAVRRGICFLDPSPGAVSRWAGPGSSAGPASDVPAAGEPDDVELEDHDPDLHPDPDPDVEHDPLGTHPPPNVTRLPDRAVALRRDPPAGVEQVG